MAGRVRTRLSRISPRLGREAWGGIENHQSGRRATWLLCRVAWLSLVSRLRVALLGEALCRVATST